jgi:hypothetical protein
MMRRHMMLPVVLMMVVLVAAGASAQSDDRVWSEWSEPVTVTTDLEPEPEPGPSVEAPSNVQAVPVDHETVEVSWDAVSGADGYQVECGETVETSATSVTVSGLTPDTEYDCRVRAYIDPDETPEDETADDGTWSDVWTSGDLEQVRGWLADRTPSADDSDLTVHNGTFTTSHDGEVVENLRIVNGTIRVQHNDVTVRNVYLEQSACSACYGIAYSPTWTHSLSGLTVEQVTVEGPRSRDGATYAVLAYGDMVLRDVHIHGHKSGVGTFGDGPVSLERVLIDDNFYYDGLHSSGVALRAGNVTLRQTMVEGGATAPFFIYEGIRNVDVSESLFHEPGSSYCMGLGSQHGATHVRVTDSAFGACGFGPVAFRDDSLEGNVWSGNFWFGSGEQIG